MRLFGAQVRPGAGARLAAQRVGGLTAGQMQALAGGAVGAGLAAGALPAGGDVLDLPLLQNTAGTFEYLGAFSLPEAWWSWGIGYGGPGEMVAMNPQNNGVRRYQIPAIGGTATQIGPTATLPTAGWGTTDNGWIMANSLRYGGRVYAGRFQMYDAIDTPWLYQTIDESMTGSWSATKRPANQGQSLRGLTGSLGVIPEAYRGLFNGYDLFACNVAGKSIISNASWGPSFMAFPSSAWSEPGDIPSVLPLAYAGGGGNWTDADKLTPEPYTIAGGGIVPGTRTFITFGTEPTRNCYGTGAACNDPCDEAQGFHGAPFRFAVMAFDLRDFVDVLNGVTQRWAVRPYNTVTTAIAPSGWHLPGWSDCWMTYNKTAWFDPILSRIYAVDQWHDAQVRVWQVNV